jgi:hypothetical protein
MTLPEVHSLIGAYVLDAVNDLERAAFDRHMRECEVCRAEVDELREASARLADGAWSVPPPALRDDVLAAIATTRQIAPISPAAPPVPAPRRSRLRLVSAAAAVVVAAAGAAASVYAVQDQRLRDQRAVAERAQAGEARVRAVLAAPDLVFKEEPMSGGGKVTVAVSRLQNAAVVMLAAGAAPTGDRVYQLWTIRDQQPVSEGPLAVGQATAVQIVNDISQASDVAVTVEQAPGAKTPSLPPTADVQL